MRHASQLSFLAVGAFIAFGVLTALALRPPTQAADLPLPLRLLADVPTRPAGKVFAGQTPRMDYESIDPVRRMLYIAYLGADEVIAFNLDRLYVSATGSNQVAAIDEGTRQIVARTAGGDYPDGIAYVPAEHRIFVADEHGGTDTVVDVDTNRTVDTIDLGGEVGNTQFDPVNGLIYSDVQTRDDIAAIDPKTGKVVARHALPGCDHDHGLLLDTPHRLAFVACDGNAKLLVVDLKTWNILSTHDVGSDPDVLAYDPGLRRLYVAAESGVVAVFEEDGQSLKTLGKAFLADEAHTVAVDPKSHRVYFALQNVGGVPTIRVMEPTGI
jgi:DNA-binding beta-propeller fold protein YncE